MVCLDCLGGIYRDKGFTLAYHMIKTDCPCCYNDLFRAVTSETDELLAHNREVCDRFKALMHEEYRIKYPEYGRVTVYTPHGVVRMEQKPS